MPIYSFMTSTYAMGIYLFGNRTFQTIKPEYIPHVMQFAVDNFDRSQIDAALENGYITQQEYDDTIALIPPSGV